MLAAMGGESGWDSCLRTTIRSAGQVLSRELGADAHLELETVFRGEGARTVVLRCRVTGVPGKAPGTVIVKAFSGGHGEEAAGGARARLLNEWSGTVFVRSRREGLVPACHGGDADAGVVLLEDLGDGLCLMDTLQDDDPDRAEEGLLTYAATLARVHAATASGQKAYEELRGALGGAGPRIDEFVYGELLRHYLPAIRDACDLLGLRFPSRLETEAGQIVRHLDEPGPFLAFSLGDMCADNNRFDVARGGPPRIRFFDLEFAGYRNAMLDAAYLLLPFPTCWCVNRLPDDLPVRLEAAYRTALVEEGLTAAEGEAFGRHLSEAMVAWFIVTTHWSLAEALHERGDWGTSTQRQRLPLRAENTARVCRRHRHMRRWADLAEELADALRKRWGEEAQMPLYPAFGGSG